MLGHTRTRDCTNSIYIKNLYEEGSQNGHSSEVTMTRNSYQLQIWDVTRYKCVVLVDLLLVALEGLFVLQCVHIMNVVQTHK